MRTHIYTSFIFLLQNFDYDDSCLTFITEERHIVHSEWYPEYKLLKPCLAVCLLLALEKPKEHFCLKKKKCSISKLKLALHCLPGAHFTVMGLLSLDCTAFFKLPQ